MKPKRSLASAALELAAVLLVTVLTFTWGIWAAQAEQGYPVLTIEAVRKRREIARSSNERTMRITTRSREEAVKRSPSEA